MIRRAAIFVYLTFIGIAGAVAQERDSGTKYPSQVINIVCTFAPGNTSDTIVRYYATQLAKRVSVPVVVLNKPGAGGAIGLTYVAKSKPDGYTILISATSTSHGSARVVFKEPAFDPIKDFMPVTTLASFSMVAFVDPKSSINSLADLTAFLKQKGDKTNYGISAFSQAAVGEMYKKVAGVQSTQVMYKGGADQLQDFFGGSLDWSILDSGNVFQLAREGRVRPIAIATPQRSAIMPSIPTFAESGYPQVQVPAWWGVTLPAGTLPAIQEKLSELFKEIGSSPETKDFLAKIGAEPVVHGSKEMGKMMVRAMEQWAEFSKVTNIQAQ
jgi:tripartite-type tricarboxylate transporter receptor subunit TctC